MQIGFYPGEWLLTCASATSGQKRFHFRLNCQTPTANGQRGICSHSFGGVLLACHKSGWDTSHITVRWHKEALLAKSPSLLLLGAEWRQKCLYIAQKYAGMPEPRKQQQMPDNKWLLGKMPPIATANNKANVVATNQEKHHEKPRTTRLTCVRHLWHKPRRTAGRLGGRLMFQLLWFLC